MFLDTCDLRNDEIYLKLYMTKKASETKGLVPAYCFRIVRVADGQTVGRCDLRVGYNERLYYGGHIGYGVDEQYRGKHYAGKACLLLFALARKHGMEYLYITCNPENTASRKTSEFAGGVLEAIVDLPADNDMYAIGERRKCIYRIIL
jgi:predicted acetyltransferase